MSGMNVALHATTGGDGAPHGRPVLTVALGPKTGAMDNEVERVFASLAELFDEPAPSRPALFHEEIFGSAAAEAGTRPRVSRGSVKAARGVALQKAHEDEDEDDLDQSQTVRIEYPVVPAAAHRSNPPAPPQVRLKASEGQPALSQPVAVAPAPPAPSLPLPRVVRPPPPVPVSMQAIPALPKVLLPPRPAPRPHAVSAEEVTLVSARPPILKPEASRPTPPVIVPPLPDRAPNASARAPFAPPPAVFPSVSTANRGLAKDPAPPVPSRGARRPVWVAAGVMGGLVLGLVGWRGALALWPVTAHDSTPESVPALTPVPASVPAAPPLAAPQASIEPTPVECLAPSPQRGTAAAASPVQGQVPSRRWGGAHVPGHETPAAWKLAAQAAVPDHPSTMSKARPPAAARLSGPLFPLEEDPC
jgi:hypothetical protein